MSRNRMAASSISRYFIRPARTSAASSPQRVTRWKSPYGNLYLALVCSDASSSTPRCQLAYSSQPRASMNSFSALVDGWGSLQLSLWSSTTWPCLIWSCATSWECLFRLVVMGSAFLPGWGIRAARGRPKAAGMEYEEIIEAIGREAADLPPDVAERAAQAALQTLAERLPRGEARHILAELPAELKPWVYTEADAEGFGIDEFL